MRDWSLLEGHSPTRFCFPFCQPLLFKMRFIPVYCTNLLSATLGLFRVVAYTEWFSKSKSIQRGFQTARVSRQLTYSPQWNISQDNLPLSAGGKERLSFVTSRAGSNPSGVIKLQLGRGGPGCVAVDSQCWAIIPSGYGGQLLCRFRFYWAMKREPELCDCFTEHPLVCCIPLEFSNLLKQTPLVFDLLISLRLLGFFPVFVC